MARDEPAREKHSKSPRTDDRLAVSAGGRSDYLSYVLSLLRVNSSSIFIFDLGEPWGIQTDEIPTPVSWTVMEGDLWMISAGSEPVALHRGDTLLLPHGSDGKSYTFVSSLDVEPIYAGDLFEQERIESFRPGTIIDRPIHLSRAGTAPGRASYRPHSASTFVG